MKFVSLANCSALYGALLFANLAPVASTHNQSWIRQLGSSEYEWASKVTPDGSGGVYICGSTLGILGGPNAGGYDAWLARYDGAGNQIWIRQFGTSSSDDANAAASDGSGGVYVSGSTEGSLGGPNAGGYDAWLARYDGAGNQIWIRQFGANSWDEARSAASDGSGAVYVCGWTDGSMNGSNLGSFDVWVARYDSAGNRTWIRQMGSSSMDDALAAAPDGSDGVYISGFTYGFLGGPNLGSADAWLAHFDNAGNRTWIRQFGSNTDDRAYAVAPDGFGGVYVCGDRATSSWVARYDAWGSRTWIRDPVFGKARAVVPNGLGGVFVSGNWQGGGGGGQAWLGNLSGTGFPTWSVIFGSIGDDFVTASAPDGSGGVFVCGYTGGSLGGANAGLLDAWLTHYDYDPEFLAPTPCGQTLSVGVDQQLTFNVSASAMNAHPGQAVSLALVAPTNALGGATFTPPLGSFAQPASSQVSWTPTAADIGLRVVRFRASDQLGYSSECEFQIFVEPNPPYVPCEQRLVSASTAPLDTQGQQVGYWYGRAIVGAPKRLVDGAVAIYEELAGVWTQVADIPHPFATGGQDSFGWAVAISGDWAVVGAPFEGTPGLFNGPGAAYVYRRGPSGGWTLFQQLQRSAVISQDDRFGVSVDISGDQLLVGAIGDNTVAPSAGAVYVYRLTANSWVLEQKLVPSVVQPTIQFGVGLSIDADRAVIGAPYEDHSGGVEVGAIYVFERQPSGTWFQTARLSGPIATSNAFYGVSVDLSGTRAIVGAEGIAGVGQAYIYRRDAATIWTLEEVLDPQNPSPSLTFGQQVRLRAGIAVVNARNATVQGLPVAGAVELFEFGTSANWIYSRTLTKATPSAFDSFGSGVALGADIALIGCPGDDSAGFANGGAAYLLDIGIADCNNNGNPDSCEIASGASQDCNGNRVPDECDILAGALDCNGNGVLDSCEVASGASLDCNVNGVPDTCDIVSGYSRDCNGTNIPDECEIAANPSLDCNGDGTIDTCQFGTLDCNHNQFLDPCETAQNPAIDINQNSIPDECEDDAGTIYCTPNAPNSGFPGGGKMQAIGTPSVNANDIVLIARDLPTNSFGFFITSRLPGFVPLPGGSQGILCLGGTIGRFQQQVQNAGTLNRIWIPIDNQSIPFPTGPGFATIVAGERWHFQAWFRDSVSGMATSSFTEGLYIQY